MASYTVLKVADPFLLMFPGDFGLAVTAETGVGREVATRMAGLADTASPLVVDRKAMLA
jgi:hypothetical protein